MKQAMIVLTLWMLSQNAYCQSARLEEYSQGNAVCASSRHSSSLINRQIMADIDPYSLPGKPETPAVQHQKARQATTQERAGQDDARTMTAYIKALEENTRALDENTKALKENTEMMRALMATGQYQYASMVTGQQTAAQRYQSAAALANQPAPHIPLLSDLQAEANIPESTPVRAAKPDVLFASASPMLPAHKAAAPVKESTEKVPSQNTTTKPTLPTTLQSKNEKTQKTTIAEATNTLVKPAAATSAEAKAILRPSICYLNNSSNSMEKGAMGSYAGKVSATSGARAATTAAERQAPRVMPVAAPKPATTGSAVKATLQPKAADPMTSRTIARPKAIAANIAMNPHAPKATATLPVVKMPVAGAATSMPKHACLPSTPVLAKGTQKTKALKAMATEPVTKIPLASAMTGTPKHANLPANPLAVKKVANIPAINTVAKPNLPVASAIKSPEHKNLAGIQKPAKTAHSAGMPARNITLKPQALNASIPAATKPVMPAANTNRLPASMALVTVTAAKPRAAASSAMERKAPLTNVSAIATSFMSVAEKGMMNSKGKKVSLGYLLRFPLLDRAYDNQMRTAEHMPADTYSGFKEGDLVTTHGYISLIAVEDSGTKNETYYLQLVVNPYRKDSCLNVRIKTDQFAGEDRKNLTATARQFVREQLLSGNSPSKSGNVMQNPVYVSITGQLVYNSALAGAMRGPRPLYIGKKGVCSYTPWEISNVNRIQFTR